MIQQRQNIDFFDQEYSVEEQIPRFFTVSFQEVGNRERNKVKVMLNDDRQIGDIINDNAYEDDFYRYHDVFHYAFATLLGWSPCTRAMMKCKRKSNDILDEVEDGARATITEEAISMIIFNEAKRKDFFRNSKRVTKTTLRIIKEMTASFEVSVRSSKDWEDAILKAYRVFRSLIDNKGGTVAFNGIKKEIRYVAFD